ncbi:MAG: ABC transporter ATP-binding protein [Thermodesulfobacteriota bacterium]|nr:ABC transporter ATP-binding protein [Thermodesulfobacteriota bacterium]
MSELLIEARDVWKIYNTGGKSVEALKGASVTVAYGEIIAIVGPSGAGKSTLLHLLGGLDRPTRGDILYKNESILPWNSGKLAALRNKKVGFLFQFNYLLPEFSAQENVMMPVLIQGIEKKKARTIASEILREVGLAERLHHKPGELSGGEQQRAALARALVMNPELLLADEPTGNLDTKTGLAIVELLLRLNTRFKTTLLIVTHNKSLAQFAKRVIVIEDGVVQAEGVTHDNFPGVTL